MAAAGTTLAYYNSGISAANFVGASGSGVGGWLAQSDVGTIGGTYYATSTAGDFFQYTIPPNTHAVYLIMRPTNSDGSASHANDTAISFQIDGVDQRGAFAVLIDSYAFGQAATRYFVPLLRYDQMDVTSGSHILKVVAYGNNRTCQIDGVLCIQSRATATTPGITLIGDSWTQHGGVTDLTFSKYSDRLYNKLLRHYKTNASGFSYSNLGQDGDMVVGQSGSTTRTGGTYRFATSFLASPTSMVTFLFGTNDLNQYSAGGFMTAVENLCALIEDSVDFNSITVVLGTPGHVTPYSLCPTTPLVVGTVTNATGRYYGGSADGNAEAVDGVRSIPEYFPRIIIADVNNALDGRSSNLYGNGSSPVDTGNHPNDAGSEKIANVFLRALLNKPVVTFHGNRR